MSGDPQVGGVPGPWMAMMSQLVPETHIPYKVRMNLITKVSKPTVDDQVPEVRDSLEASQDQAEEASDEKDSIEAHRGETSCLYGLLLQYNGFGIPS